MVIPAGPAGNSLELCRYLPGPISRLKDHCPVLLGIFLVCRRLPRESPDNQDLSSRLPVRGHYCTTRYLKCRNTLLKNNICAVFPFTEKFLIQGLVWDIFGPSQSLKSHSVCVCVCVCAKHTNRAVLPIVCYFQRRVVPLAPYFQSRALFCRHEKEKREQSIYFRTVLHCIL